MNNAASVSIILCFVSVLCDDEYADVKDTYEMPIFDTCGTLLHEYINSSLRTLTSAERNMFYDSYVIDRIKRQDNLTLERLKGEPTLDYDAINDTHEQTLFQTCGTLLQHYWENYSLRNLTSSERNFYYDEDNMKVIKKEEEQMIQERKDQEWLKKMENRVINDHLDSLERRKTTDIVYHDWVSPVPKTTGMLISPIDDLYISQASNVSDTDISLSTYNREMKYGDAPKWLTDRFDKIQDEYIRMKDKKAIEDAVLRGLLPSTGKIEVQPLTITGKRRLLTHRYDRTMKRIHRKTISKSRCKFTDHFLLGKVKRSADAGEKNTTERQIRKRNKITNEDGVWILKQWADKVRQGELELEREEKKTKKEAEALKIKIEKNKIKQEKKLKRLLSSSIRSTKFTRKRTTNTHRTSPKTEDSWETTVTEIIPTRRQLYVTLVHSLGTYGYFNPAKEVTEPNAEQTEVNFDEFFNYLAPSTQATRKWANTTTPRKRLRQTTTPYVEHTMPNRFNRTVYYWLYERLYAKHSTPTPQIDSCGLISMEHSKERPLELKFMDYLFDTRRKKPTLKLNLTTVTISAKEYENFLAKHQIYRKVYEDHWRLATMNHWNLIGDSRFQKGNIKSKFGVDFYDRRPYSSTRRQDNLNYMDMMDFLGNNHTQPNFKNQKYTFADSYDYQDVWEKYLLDPGHVTANWTTVDFQNVQFPIGNHQRYPNGSLKSAEVLIKEDYEFRKNVFGKSCEIYNEEFANPEDLTKPSEEYIEHRRQQDRFFYPNVSLTIGPKHAQKSVYDMYDEPEYEDWYRKWRDQRKHDPMNNISLERETREDTYVDPQVIIDQAYKYTTTYNPFKHETIPTEKGEVGIKLKLIVNPKADLVLP